MNGKTKEPGLSALSVVVVGGTLEQRRAVGQMTFAGLQIMSGGLFTPQIHCADSLKSHVTSGDLAEISGRGIDAIRLQLAAHANMQTDTSDSIDNFKPDQGEFAQPMDVAPFVEPSVSEKLIARRLTTNATQPTTIKVMGRDYSFDEFSSLVETGNFNEATLTAMESLLKFAELVARINAAVKPKAEVVPETALPAGHFSLSVREDHGMDGEGKLFEPQ